MLESFHLWPHIRARLESGPLGPHLEAYVGFLSAADYSRRVIRRYLQAADRFSVYLLRHHKRAADVDDSTVSQFIQGQHRTHPPSSRQRVGRLPETASGVRNLAHFLWTKGISRRESEAAAASPQNQFLRDYDQYLDRVQGLAPGTRDNYLRYAGILLRSQFGEAAPDWSALTAECIVEFVQRQAAQLRPAHCRMPVTAVRAVLRYLVAQGLVRSGLDAAVPTIRQWRQATLPRHLTASQFESVLDGCAGQSLVQHRDRAILLLLGRLGLRAGEVVRLRLEDIDWPQGRLLVRAGKTSRERVLPLTPQVGRALVDYLRLRGAHGTERRLFLCIRPQGRPLTTAAVSSLAKSALQRAGIAVSCMGAHTLRHTAATQMFQNGAPFKAIADVLGHACLETTAIYAKLDLPGLRSLALPWPQGEP